MVGEGDFVNLSGIVQFLSTYLGPFVLVLGVLVFVHELGHFLVAKAMGVRVLRFSLGFGPRLAGVTVGETDYRLSLLPLGGYVKMAGDENGEATGAPGEFLSSPWWARALIAVAGPASNVLFAFVFAWAALVVGLRYPDYPPIVHGSARSTIADSLGVHSGDRIAAVNDSTVTSWQSFLHLLFDEDALGQGPSASWPRTVRFAGAAGETTVRVDETTAVRLAQAIQPAHPPVVGNAIVNLPAYQAGMQAGDSIVAIAGTRVSTYEDLAEIIHASVDKPLTIDLVRRGRPVRVTVKPISQEVAGGPAIGMIGIEPRTTSMVYVQALSPLEAAKAAGPLVVAYTGQIIKGLGRTLTHVQQARDALTGPIGIAQMAASAATKGISELLSLAMIISLSLALMNVLPVPILDGGHIAFAIYEGVARRPLSLNAQLAFQRVGLALIGLLFVFVIMNDTVRLVERSRAVRTDTRAPSPSPATVPSR